MDLFIKRKSKGVGVVIVLIILAVIVGAITLPIVLVANYLGGGIDKATGAVGPAGYSCIVGDSYFTDTSIVDKSEQIISAITKRWEAAKTNEKYIKEVFKFFDVP